MKRFVALLLVIMTLGSTLLGAGCSIVTRGSDYCYKFLDYIANAEFDKAYEMIADSIKAPETEEEKADRLKKEAEAKAEKQRFWRELFGLSDEKAEATPSPTAEPTPTPEEPEPTPTPLAENGMTPDPVTGELPEVTPTPTPDPNATPTPELAAEPGTTPGVTPTATPKVSKKIEETPTPSLEPGATPSPTPVPLDEDGNPIPVQTITKVAFIDRYQSIFDELELTGIDYATTDVTDGEIVAKVKYTLTYHSARAGEDLTYDFEIRADRIEHRWTIAWSPSLIFPMMEWGDSLRVGTLQANRGEILCDGEPYAQNVAKVTIFAVPSTIENVETFVADTAAIPELELTEADVREKLGKARNDFAKMAEFFPDEMTADLKTRVLAVQGMAIDANNYGTLRYYPYGQSLCHIIGYAGIISKKEKINYEAYGDIYYDEEQQKYITKGSTRYNGDSWIGKYGLELLYENQLLGTNGRFTYIQDAQGGSRGMLYKTDAVEGNDLHLTIIPELQERLEDVVTTTVYDSSMHGSVVVLNPKTGAIEAMTSWPGFDLNYLARGMPEEEWAAMENDPDIPLYNRATQGLYTPGSVFKTMTAAAIIETNTMTVNDQFPSSEEIDEDYWMPSESLMAAMPTGTFGEPLEGVEDMTFAEQADDKALKRSGNSGRHTPMNLINSIVDSDNLYFAYAALRMGANKFETYMVDKLGWNIPIQLEAAGTDPRIYWKAGSDGVSWQNLAEGGEPIYKYDGEGKLVETGNNLVLDKKLYGMDVSTPQLYAADKQQSYYDLAVTGFGQGQILMSPLQMACYVSAYANDGKIMQPYLVDSIWHADGTDYSLVEQKEPTVYKQLLQQSTVDALYPALLMVPKEGTAKSMYKSFLTKVPLTLGYELAGKTGTAEITNNKTKELAWFICWRDADTETKEKVTEENARLVCIMMEVNLVTMDGKPEWSQMKYDIARAMLKKDVLNNDNMA